MIIAHLADAQQLTIDILAVIHVLARVAYGVCYIRNLPSARSLIWVVGFLPVLGLFIAAF